MPALRYLSLFSGIGGFEVGIKSVFPDVECVGFSEIDPYPSGIYQNRFPGHPALGDISKIESERLPKFDLLVGGFPCTDLSIANVENLGLKGARSGLLCEAVRILRDTRPRYFVIENVASMKAKNREAISRILGVEPVMLNAAEVSCQNRERLFWANFPISPLNKIQCRLSSVLEQNVNSALLLSEREIAYMDRRVSGGRNHWDFGHHHDTDMEKSRCLPANLHKGVPYNVIIDRRSGEAVYRKLSAVEAERMMGFPDNFTQREENGKIVSNSRRYKCLGNSVSVPVATHVFECLRDFRGN